MSAPADSPGQEAAEQPGLPGLEEMLRVETGMDTLPAGAGELQGGELAFVIALLRHGQQRRAAIEAGYSETSAGQIASELLKKPRVRRVYMACLDKLAGVAAAAVRRIEERGRIFHEKALQAAQEREDIEDKLNELVLLGTTGKNATYETRREELRRLEREYAGQAMKCDEALLRAAGKFGMDVKVSGKIEGGAVMVTPEVLSVLTGLREGREVAHA